MRKTFLSSGFVLTGVCLSAYFSVNAQPDNAVTATTQVYKINGKTGMNGSNHTFLDGKEYNIMIRKGTVTEMYIDGEKIRAEKIVEYKTALDKIFYRFKTNGEQAVRDKEQAMRTPYSGHSSREMEKIIEELIKENILKNRKELYSLHLNITELEVNGVKQPAAIHKRFKDKYVESETLTWVYETN